MIINEEIQHKGIFFGIADEGGKFHPVAFRKYGVLTDINYHGDGFSRKSDAIGWGRKKINEKVG